MSVLTLSSDEYQTFPPILREYASYIVAIKGNSEHTVCEYLLDLRTFFRWKIMTDRHLQFDPAEFEKISISSVDLDLIKTVTQQNIIEFLMFTGYGKKNSTTTRMRKLAALRSFFKYLFSKRHYIESNPTAEVEGPKPSKTLPKFLNMEEAVALLTTIRNDVYSKTKVRDYAIVCLFLNTGIRVSELVELNINSFDSNLTKMKVLGKGSKERFVYLNESAASALKDYIPERLDPKYVRNETQAFFLSGREQRISVKTVQWIVYKYLDLAGLGNRGLSVHKLRHTAATLMYQSGQVDIRVLKDVLGHEQLNTTQIYTHIVDRNLQSAVDNNPLAKVKIKKGYIDDNDRDED